MTHRGAAFHTVRIMDFADRLPGRYWHRVSGLPPGPPDHSPAARQRLRNALSEYFGREEGRGQVASVEHYVRAGREHYFVCFCDDYTQTFTTHDANRRLARAPLRGTFEVVFAFDADDGVLDTYAPVRRAARLDLQDQFLGVALPAPPAEVAAAGPVLDVQPPPGRVPHPVIGGDTPVGRRLLESAEDALPVVRVDLLSPPYCGGRNLVGAVAEDFGQPPRPLDRPGRHVLLVDDAVHGVGGEPEPLPLAPRLRPLPHRPAAGRMEGFAQADDNAAGEQVGGEADPLAQAVRPRRPTRFDEQVRAGEEPEGGGEQGRAVHADGYRPERRRERQGVPEPRVDQPTDQHRRRHAQDGHEIRLQTRSIHIAAGMVLRSRVGTQTGVERGGRWPSVTDQSRP